MNNCWYVIFVYYLDKYNFNTLKYFYIIFNDKDRGHAFISDGIKGHRYKKISKILWEQTSLGINAYQMECPPFNSIKELVEIISYLHLIPQTEKYISYSWFKEKINIKYKYKNIYKIKIKRE